MNQLLIINAPPELEDDTLDFLLNMHQVNGFTSYAVRGHGEHRCKGSIAEQVSGRRQRIQFELIVEEQDIEKILSGLQSHVGGDIFYWQQPIQGFGRID